jgi:hypothetical protein
MLHHLPCHKIDVGSFTHKYTHTHTYIYIIYIYIYIYIHTFYDDIVCISKLGYILNLQVINRYLLTEED